MLPRGENGQNRQRCDPRADPGPQAAPVNHVGLSMPPAALDDGARADILAFYGDVFGWQELRPIPPIGRSW